MWPRQRVLDYCVFLVTLTFIGVSACLSLPLSCALCEATALALALIVFTSAWNVRRLLPESYGLIVGVGLLFAAILMLLSLLARSGMDVAPPGHVDIATELLVAAAVVLCLSLAGAPLCGRRRRSTVAVVGTFASLASLLLAGAAWWHVFPSCRIGDRPTTFAVVTGWLLAAGVVVAIALHARFDLHLSTMARRQLVVALLLLAVAAPLATTHAGRRDAADLTWHLLLPTATFLIYQSVVSGGMARTYEHLVAELREKTTALEHLSAHDDLTGLYNRRGFLMLAEQALALAMRQKLSVTLLFGDVDDLKTVNDTLGHAAGDRVLQTVAQALASCFRSADVVARMGGDEFAVLCVGAHHCPHDVLAGRFAMALASQTAPPGVRRPLSMTLGTADALAGHVMEIDDLLARADEDMYRRKAAAQTPSPGTAAAAESDSSAAADRDQCVPHDAPGAQSGAIGDTV